MAVSEQQLITWSAQGSTTQSAATYATIKSVLEDSGAPYASRDFDVFLQGSYGNYTNIYADSDVDIVICLTSTYYSGTNRLNETEKANYQRNRAPAAYGIDQFKLEVFNWLRQKFGPAVKMGNKAIRIPGNSSRRDADVLACAEYREYISYSLHAPSRYHPGIVFWTGSGDMIVNYPKQHQSNCTAKHQNTYSRFKPNVRVLKNMRNKMIDLKLINKSLAPSYFLEGMLWNAPNAYFNSTYASAIQSYLNWLWRCDPSTLLCANGIHPLIHTPSPTSWNLQDFQTLRQSLQAFWDSQ